MEIPRTCNFQDLTGKKFGKYTVIDYAGPASPHKVNKEHSWNCLCECGREKVVRGASLKSGQTQSCGCFHKAILKKRVIDLTGKKFGLLTVVGFSGEYRGCELLWQCQCECGQSKLIRGVSLRNGDTKSCGCRQGQFIHGLWGTPEYKKWYFTDPARRLRHNVSCAIRDALTLRGGGKRGHSAFEYLPYTIEDLKAHIESQFEDWMTWKNYGGPNNSAQKTWHIDHIKPQSSFRFTSLEDKQFTECWSLSNLRPLEKRANMEKGSG